MTNEPPATVNVVAQAKRHARASGLVYVSDADPGIRRERCGRGFRYLAPNHRPITAARTLERIRALAIPPAYTQVWICREPRGHLQATGRDARRRKQYRYHPRWRETRDDGKFSRMIEFGARLPRLRRRLKQDLALPGLPKRKVLAVIVSLLDETLIRVGNAEYARSNDSYGLTTLRDKHVRFLRDGRAWFRFRGKSGREQEVVLDDRRLAQVIRRCQQLPGQQLFQYLDDEGRRQPVDSEMVNEYLREAMYGDAPPPAAGAKARPPRNTKTNAKTNAKTDAKTGGTTSGTTNAPTNAPSFTAKDFRTWGGTVRAVAFLSCQEREDPLSERAYAACMAATAKDVAAALGNTAAVCRKSYINPVVFEAWRAGLVEAHVPKRVTTPKRLERATLALLREHARALSRAKSRRARA